MALHKFTPGGCRQDCGSSGVTVDCPCTPPCDAGTTRNAYTVQWDTPGGPHGSGTFTYTSAGAGGCKYTNGSTYSVCGVTCYGELYINGATAQFLLRRSSDHAVVVTFSFTTLLGTADCSQNYALDPGLVPGIGCGNVPLTTASVTPNGTTEVDCIETPYTIPANPNSCCPCENCRLLRDDFNRAAGTDLGANWTETAGNWTLESPSRLATDDTSAIVLSTTSSSAVGIAVTAKGASGDKIRLIAGYQNSSNYFYAEFTWGTGVIDLYKRSGGSDTLLQTGTGTLAANEYARIFFCLDGTGVVAARTTAGAGIRVTASSTSPTGSQYGLGTGTTNSGSVQFALFDSYVISAACEACTQIIEHQGCPFLGSIGCCSQLDETFEYEVDFGAGGWTDSDCSACDTISGVFVVQRVNSFCDWWYIDEQYCPSTCPPDCEAYWTLTIRLTRSGAVNCKWVVTVTLSNTCTSSSESACGNSRADFEDSFVSAATSCAGTWTLSRTANTHTGSLVPCAGTMPATIGLASV